MFSGPTCPTSPIGRRNLAASALRQPTGDDVAASGETLDDIAADEPRPAEHRGSAISHGFPLLRPLVGVELAHTYKPAQRAGRSASLSPLAYPIAR